MISQYDCTSLISCYTVRNIEVEKLKGKNMHKQDNHTLPNGKSTNEEYDKKTYINKQSTNTIYYGSLSRYVHLVLHRISLWSEEEEQGAIHSMPLSVPLFLSTENGCPKSPLYITRITRLNRSWRKKYKVIRLHMTRQSKVISKKLWYKWVEFWKEVHGSNHRIG